MLTATLIGYVLLSQTAITSCCGVFRKSTPLPRRQRPNGKRPPPRHIGAGADLGVPQKELGQRRTGSLAVGHYDPR